MPALALDALLEQFLLPRDDDHRKVVRGKNRTITEATLLELVNVLTDEREYSRRSMIDLIDLFFLFFRSFVPSAVVLDMFIKRYKECPPEGISELDLIMWHVHHRMAKIHVARLLVLWLELHWRDDADGHLVKDINQFQIGTLCKDPDIPIQWAKKAGNYLFDRLSTPTGPLGRWLHLEMAKTEKAAETYPPTGFEVTQLPQWAKLCPFNPTTVIRITDFRQTGGRTELSRLLTVIESEFFHSFLPEDLIRFKDEVLQRKLHAWTKFSNGLTLWVVASILDQKDASDRAAMVYFFISLACVSVLIFILHITIADTRSFRNAEEYVISALRLLSTSRCNLLASRVCMKRRT